MQLGATEQSILDLEDMHLETITPQCQAEDTSLSLTTKGNHSTISGGACIFDIDHEEHSLHNVRRRMHLLRS